MAEVEVNQPRQPPRDDARVQVALGRLAELDTIGIDASVAVYDDIHRSLSAALEGPALEGPAPDGGTEPVRAPE